MFEQVTLFATTRRSSTSTLWPNYWSASEFPPCPELQWPRHGTTISQMPCHAPSTFRQTFQLYNWIITELLKSTSRHLAAYCRTTQCQAVTVEWPTREVRWYTLCLKKVPTFKLSVALSTLSRFSKFLHCWKAYEISYKTHLTLPASP